MKTIRVPKLVNYLVNYCKITVVWQFFNETLLTRAGSGLFISMLKKLSWFCLTGLRMLVLSMRKWMGLLLRKNHLLWRWGCLEPLAHCWNVASLSLFHRYYFGRFSSELAGLVPLICFLGKCTLYSDKLNDFSVTIPRCYKNAYVNSFFPRAFRLWNSLPKDYFPLTYDLNRVLSKQISCTL